MENQDILRHLETLLFITDKPIPSEKLAALLEREEPAVRDLLGQLQNSYMDSGRALQVVESGGGFQLATKPEYASCVRKLYRERMTARLSVASLETLAIIAYRQPLTRAEIETIRGVEVIAALETLVERGLIKVDGRKETVGRPLLYVTTPEFLRFFGFNSLEDMPKLETLVEKKPEQPQEEQDTGLPVDETPAAPPEPENQQQLPMDEENAAGNNQDGGEPEQTAQEPDNENSPEDKDAGAQDTPQDDVGSAESSLPAEEKEAGEEPKTEQ
ncbi:MAG: SMC-Scp complex subunit ScpB [Elusimicrobia bacterium]|nr:SMC-Scp complex subunit ScpB [Elusimicrobiota bacterium]